MTPFRTPFNYEPELPVVSIQPSMTEPDQCLSLREILQRYAQGKPLTKNNRLMYTGDDFTPDLRSMDLVEIDDLKKEVDQNIKEIQLDLKRSEARAKQAAKKAEAEKQGEGTEQSVKADAKGQASEARKTSAGEP